MPGDSAGGAHGSRGLSPVRLRQIEAAAEAARARAEAKAALTGLEPPTIFDLVMLAAGGPLRPVPNLSHDGERTAGLLDCTGPVPRVLYEAYDVVPRQRFSVAHELGHLVLHEARRRGRSVGCDQRDVDPPDGDGEPPGADDEAEADAFAAAFLMPREVLTAAVALYGFGSGFLAERFEVSATALRRRWMTLRGVG